MDRKQSLTTVRCFAVHAAATGGAAGDEHNLDLSLGSSAGNKRGSLDGGGGGGGDDKSSDQRVPMAFDIDWQTAARRSTKAKVSVLVWSRPRSAFSESNEVCV
jgi:hypothetical protein